jgi:hypothetical protein
MHLKTYSARTDQSKTQKDKPGRFAPLIYVYVVSHPGAKDCPINRGHASKFANFGLDFPYFY